MVNWYYEERRLVTVDTTKKFIFVWVPGTGGHGVHPAFREAVKNMVGDDAQLLHVEYPATWNFDESVPVGEQALKDLLKVIAAEKTLEQKVLVGGSSQGAWVISNVYGHTSYNDTFAALPLPPVVHKTVMFGHPGVAENHDHEFVMGDNVWEIADENDAVTFKWPGQERRLVRALVDVQKGKVWKLPVLLWATLTHPVRAFKMLWLIACYTGLVKWTDSPHEYGQKMPLAVYWLVN
jgi:hypothetical protein